MPAAALKRKFVTARNLLDYGYSQLTRASADRAIAPIAQVATKIPGAILCDGLWDNPHHWLRVAMFRAAAAEIYGSDLVGVYEASTGSRTVASLRALSLTAEEVVPDLIPERFAQTAAAMLRGAKTPRDFMSIEFPTGYPAHLLYDSIIKAEKLGQVDCRSKATQAHVARALLHLDVYSQMLDRYPIKAVVLSHPSPARFSTLAWAALCRKLPVFILNYVNQHITIRRLDRCFEGNGTARDLPSPAIRDALLPSQRDYYVKKGRDYLGLLQKGATGQISMLKAYGKGVPRYQTTAEFVRAAGATTNKPNIAVLGNCWPDFPNVDGTSWYTDYVDWMRTTLEIIQTKPSYNWFLKPHPAEHLYGRRVSLRQLVGNDLPQGVYHWPEQAIGGDVLAHVDCVVTASGTSGIEYSAAGRRVLVSRQTHYTDWGFSNYASDRTEFSIMLHNAAQLPLPSQRQQDDASIYVALTFADPDPGSRRLLLPYGLNSYRLWPAIPDFIADNRDRITAEVALMKDWLRTDSESFNVYAALRESQ